MDLLLALMLSVAAPMVATGPDLPDTTRVPVGPVIAAPIPRVEPILVVGTDTIQQRPQAVELSDGYYTRLRIHYLASWATIPLFAAEVVLGQQMYDQNPPSSSTRQMHAAVATTLGALFVANTVTGVWNLWEGRHQTEGRTLRWVHAGLMMAANAGMVWAASSAPGSEGGSISTPDQRSHHRNIAIGTMSVATVGYLTMLLFGR